jgi:protein TonB
MILRLPAFTVLAIAAAACVASGRSRAPEASPQSRTACAGVANADTTVYDSAQVTQPPALRSLPTPTYPRDALRRKVQGRVVVTAITNSDGTIDQGSVAIADSLDPALDGEARRIMAGATVWPACLNGLAVRARITVPVDFSVHTAISGAVLVGAAGAVMGGVMVITGTQMQAFPTR